MSHTTKITEDLNIFTLKSCLISQNDNAGDNENYTKAIKIIFFH